MKFKATFCHLSSHFWTAGSGTNTNRTPCPCLSYSLHLWGWGVGGGSGFSHCSSPDTHDSYYYFSQVPAPMTLMTWVLVLVHFLPRRHSWLIIVLVHFFSKWCTWLLFLFHSTLCWHALSFCHCLWHCAPLVVLPCKSFSILGDGHNHAIKSVWAFVAMVDSLPCQDCGPCYSWLGPGTSTNI